MAVIKKVAIPEGTSSSVKSIISGRKSEKGKVKASVPTVETLEDLYGNSLPNPTMTIDDYVRGLHNQAKSNVEVANAIICARGEQAIENPTDAAFNNCNGHWTEYGYAVYAWNSLAKLNTNSKEAASGNAHQVYVYVKLPNRRDEKSEWTQLLHTNIAEQLNNHKAMLSMQIKSGRSFNLISSNPDAVILKFDSEKEKAILQKISLNLYSPIDKIDHTVVGSLDKIFTSLAKTVTPAANLQSFLSIKNSTRPDRRLQWVQEGTNAKAILQYILNLGLDVFNKDALDKKYYAVLLGKATKGDQAAMDTVYVGSIVTPMLGAMWAVDKLFECPSFAEIEGQIIEIIGNK